MLSLQFVLPISKQTECLKKCSMISGGERTLAGTRRASKDTFACVRSHAGARIVVALALAVMASGCATFSSPPGTYYIPPASIAAPTHRAVTHSYVSDQRLSILLMLVR